MLYGSTGDEKEEINKSAIGAEEMVGISGEGQSAVPGSDMRLGCEIRRFIFGIHCTFFHNMI